MSAERQADAAGELVSAIVLPLLQEYTERLRTRCAQYLDRPLPWVPVVTGFLSVVLVVSAALIFKQNGMHLDALGAATVISVAVAAFGLFWTWRFAERRGRLNRFERLDVATVAARLEKVVRLASQLEDHAADDLATRIQLELRLADAEATIELARAVLTPQRFVIRGVDLPLMKLDIEESKGGHPAESAVERSLRERHS